MANTTSAQRRTGRAEDTDPPGQTSAPPLSFRLAGGGAGVVRSVVDLHGAEHATELNVPGLQAGPDLHAEFDRAWLRLEAAPWPATGSPALRVADVFSSCGGLALGACEAAWALGFGHEVVLAVDTDEVALGVFRGNFSPRLASSAPVQSSFDGEVGGRLTRSERNLRANAGRVDLLLAGPPCQGHSDLNNHTRRADPKNALYARMARCAEVLRPTHVVLENVPGILHDTGDVVSRTAEHLRRLRYCVSSRTLDAAAFGVPQRRRRHFLVASRACEPDLGSLGGVYGCPERNLNWAIGDLVDRQTDAAFDAPSRQSDVNVARIRHLFDRDLHDLPDARRPDCHRLKPHSYKAMYGRMWWDRPAPTITSGFGSPGQGRFVHPLRRRTLTPHEAARTQSFPDFFRFGDARRGALQRMIGNAVPSKLAFVVVLDLLRRSPRP